MKIDKIESFFIRKRLCDSDSYRYGYQRRRTDRLLGLSGSR